MLKGHIKPAKKCFLSRTLLCENLPPHNGYILNMFSVQMYFTDALFKCVSWNSRDNLVEHSLLEIFSICSRHKRRRGELMR